MIRAVQLEYGDERCDELLRHMSMGYSFESFASMCNITGEILVSWVGTYPDFAFAKKQGIEKRRTALESIAIDAISGISKTNKFNAVAWMFVMKNAFPEEWKEVVKSESIVKYSDIDDVKSLEKACLDAAQWKLGRDSKLKSVL